MAEIKTDDRALRNLKDKIVVITGNMIRLRGRLSIN